MRDRRSVDELSIEELEQVLAIKKRQAREATLRRLQGEGRIVEVNAARDTAPPSAAARNAPIEPAGARYRSVEVDAAPARRFRLQINWRTWRDRLLLLVEAGALVGLVLVVIGMEQSRQALNRDAVAARDLPTAQPTPLIAAVVLPSGHRPPTAPGGAAPNPDEIPPHLRAYVQAATPMPIPTSGPGQPTRIVIPAIGVDSTIVQGTDWEQLKKGAGHQPGTANPGERGNLVLAAHNDVFGEIFRDLDQLQPGDEVIVYSVEQQFRYVVSETRIVAPTAVEVMNSTSEPTATLISCYPYLIDTERIVVIATLQS